MKKKLYYVMPFIIVPLLILSCELLEDTELLKMNPYIFGAFLVLSSAIFGFFSPSNKSVDYLITLIMPLSLFCSMFVGGFLSKSDLETRFHLHIAVDVAFQPIALIFYFAMAIITFITSLKFFKNLKIRSAS